LRKAKILAVQKNTSLPGLLTQTLYNNFNLKETDELVEIWQKNDRVQWTDAVVVASFFTSLLGLGQMQKTVLSFSLDSGPGLNFTAWLIAIVLFIFSVGLQSIVLYFPLKALGYILKILMEMEFNSRGVTKTKHA
jgi:hypothetical protein